MKNLIIVESPSKTKTLKKFLGDAFDIKASVGHIRDLPQKDLGIDTEHGFKPTYVVSPDKKKVIRDIRASLKEVDMLYLATDPDREGEAISWHLLEVLKPQIPVKRLVFNEITKAAILEAFEHTRDIDTNLVAAQETRRIMDRLFGFPVSKVLWYNVKGGLSAGRVQSPAIKLIVDREKLRSQFKASEYWGIEGEFLAGDEPFKAELVELEQKRVASGKDFNKNTGALSASDTIVIDEQLAKRTAEKFLERKWAVSNIEEKPITSNPYPPFITSTLQQEGVRKLHISSRQVMRSAQHLYENGYITYIRTDSVHLSNEAVQAARKAIADLYGEQYLSDKPRIYKSKVKNAQEAHEAIRPAGSKFRSPEELKTELTGKDWQLYDLIWKRSIACQMASAKLLQTTVKISGGDAVFRVRGRVIQFQGYFKAYVKSREKEAKLEDREKLLPTLKEGQELDCGQMTPVQHFTKPTARYTEASLIKEMESLGIGRPSTYASIMDTIQTRGYVKKVNGALVPTFTAYAVVQFLERHFRDLVDLQFTANLEESLDGISRAELDAGSFLDHFYFGEGEHPGLKNLTDQEFDKQQSRLIMTVEDAQGNPVQLRIGRYGIYLQNGETNATLPEDFIPSELKPEKITELLQKKNMEPKQFPPLPGSDEPILLKTGRFGPYLQCGKKMKSLLPGMTVEEVTGTIAQKIIALPRNLGDYKGDPVMADIGRYGPYIKCGKVNRKVEPPLNLLELTLQEAVGLLESSPAKRSSTVIRELGEDKTNGKPIVLKKGRYGPYVTDGEVNATLPRNLTPEELTLGEAQQLIIDKRAKGPVKRKTYKRKK
ncbi:MAG: type I DNA topoisomerase [FCB group bacterium]|nr:type I DNA topoisomerase [FCB group bacterium]